MRSRRILIRNYSYFLQFIPMLSLTLTFIQTSGMTQYFIFLSKYQYLLKSITFISTPSKWTIYYFLQSSTIISSTKITGHFNKCLNTGINLIFIECDIGRFGMRSIIIACERFIFFKMKITQSYRNFSSSFWINMEPIP